jgi:hypothetical protein
MTVESDSTDRTVLPPADPPFEGKIAMSFKDSQPDFPKPLSAPEGAPNVLLIMGDDIGYGHMARSAAPHAHPCSTGWRRMD